jgi:tetratricopeptide (TPR) repeat protein
MRTLVKVSVLAGLILPCIFSAGVCAQQASGPQAAANAATDSSGNDAYYYLTIGHLQEQQFEIDNSAATASQAIDSYKKALALAPDSAVIMDRLAEIYAKAQRVPEATDEAQEVLKRDPDNVDAHRLLAQIYVRTLGDTNAGDSQQENIGKAKAEFQAILKLQPDDVYSSLWLARLYRFENHPDDAEKVLRSVLEHDSSNGPALEQLSQILVDEGRSQEAIVLLTQAAGDSSSPDIYDLLGDAYAQSKDFAKSEQAYRKAVEEDPDDPGHRHGLAQALMSENKFADALEQFKKLTEIEPGTAENYLRMSQLYRHLGQFTDSESALLKAKQLAPGNLEILYNEALLYEDERRYDDAVKVLSDAIAGIKSQGPSDQGTGALAILYEQLGEAYRQAQNYSAAIETYEEMGKLSTELEKHAQALEIETFRANHDLDKAIAEAKRALADSPKDPNMIVTLATLYSEKSDLPSAMKLLQGLIQGNEDDQQIYLTMAQFQERNRQFAEAEQSADKAEKLASDPSDKQTAWYMLGAIFERQKKYDQAEQEFRKVLDQNPDDGAVLNYFGYMLADRGIRLDEATAMIQKAVKQDPDNGAYLDSLGWAYYKADKYTDAEEYLRHAVERDGDDPTILSHLANVYMKLGQTDQAVQLLEKSQAQWQKQLPADFEADKSAEVDAQLKTLKRRLAQKSPAETAKPQ